MELNHHISKYCTYGEAIHSQEAERDGIDNTPDSIQLAKMVYVANEVFDRVREYIGPIIPSSFFRTPKLNERTKGSSITSQHMKGEAVDMFKPGFHVKMFKFIIDHIEFDQLIWEYGTDKEPAWVHCSKVSDRPNRKMILQARLDINGKPEYIPFKLKI